MTRSNLKAVESAKPEQLSHEEIRELSYKLANMMCQDMDALNTLLIFAVQIMEHPYDSLYVSDIGTQLAQAVYNTSNESLSAVVRQAEEYRRKVMSNG
jgi:hypothetical protein